MPLPREPNAQAKGDEVRSTPSGTRAQAVKYFLVPLAAVFVMSAYFAMGLRPGRQTPDPKEPPAAKSLQTGSMPRDKNVIGRWCGTESSYVIGQQKMVVTRHSDGTALEFEVTAIESREGQVSVSWRRQDGKVVRTDFTEFSADGLRMVQLSNSGGPRREFRRC